MGVRMIASLIIWPAFEKKIITIVVRVEYTNPNVQIQLIGVAITRKKQNQFITYR